MPRTRSGIEFRNRKGGCTMKIGSEPAAFISARHLSIKEMNAYRRQYVLTNAGYVKTRNQYSKQISADHIVEITEKKYNVEQTDIVKDDDGKWEKEPAKDREYYPYHDKKSGNTPLEQNLKT